MASNERRPLRILCFGDSLTSGYCSWGAIHQPYSEVLEQLLSQGLPGRHVEAVEDGEDGDFVTARMPLRDGFAHRIKKHFGPGKPKYDWTIILGGTNDLGLLVDPERLFQALKDIYAVPLAHGSNVLALTIPEARANTVRGRERMAVARDEVNGLIKAYAKETPNFHVYDLHAEVPYYAMSESDRKRYWDDGLHFTPDGYARIGQKVGTGLLAILAQQTAAQQPAAAVGATPPTAQNGTGGTSSAGEIKQKDSAGVGTAREATPPTRRPIKGFRDDDKVFEEERGSAVELERGYIVVRKKDLF